MRDVPVQVGVERLDVVPANADLARANAHLQERSAEVADEEDHPVTDERDAGQSHERGAKPQLAGRGRGASPREGGHANPPVMCEMIDSSGGFDSEQGDALYAVLLARITC